MMASPPPPRRRWLLEGAGATFQHVLTASTVTYMTKLSSEHTVPYDYEPRLIARLLGAVLEAVSAYGVSVYSVNERLCVYRCHRSPHSALICVINSHSGVSCLV